MILATLGCGVTRPTPVGPRYTVTAPLLVLRGHPVYACNAILASYPPAGCSGVEVANVTVAAIPGITSFPNGTLQTPTLRLVGVWDGHKLTLTEPPQSSENGSEPKPVTQPPPTTSTGTDLEVDQRIAHDMPELGQGGIQVIWVGIGAQGVDLLLAVADESAVDAIYGRYGRVSISGWLQPA